MASPGAPFAGPGAADRSVALVTGASGFLGGRLVELLRERGVAVVVLARGSSRVPELAGVRVLRAELDAGLAAGVADSVSDVTHVFHCAGCSTDWAPRTQYVAANVDGVAGMLRLASAHMPRLQRFVHVSTTDVYGYPERAGDETQPHVDTGLPYNQTKLQGEALVWRAAADGLPATVVRPASIYGPGGKAFVTDIVTLLRERLMLLVDGGRAQGGFVYVDDVCEGMLRAGFAPNSLGQAYNLSSRDGVSWKQYVGALAAVAGLPVPWLQLPFGAAMALATVSEWPHKAGVPGRPLLTRHAVYLLARDQGYGTEKARVELGWVPRVGLVDGVRRAVVGGVPGLKCTSG